MGPEPHPPGTLVTPLVVHLTTLVAAVDVDLPLVTSHRANTAVTLVTLGVSAHVPHVGIVGTPLVSVVDTGVRVTEPTTATPAGTTAAGTTAHTAVATVTCVVVVTVAVVPVAAVVVPTVVASTVIPTIVLIAPVVVDVTTSIPTHTDTTDAATSRSTGAPHSTQRCTSVPREERGGLKAKGGVPPACGQVIKNTGAIVSSEGVMHRAGARTRT